MKDPRHLAFLRGLPCAMCLRPPPCDAHHSTAHRRGLGLKASDRHAFPLCNGPDGCHDQFHSARGRFKGWDKEKRRLWQRAMVDLYNVTKEAFF